VKILVTGGAGFIGSNFIHYWLREHPEDEVINFDKLTYAGNLENLRDVENNVRYKFVRGDICDYNTVKKVVRKKKVEVVVNFAAESHVDRSIYSPENFVKTNVYGTYVLLEVVRKLDVNLYLHISTDEVYGSIVKGEFDEEAPLCPSSPYAATKASADHLVKSYLTTYGIPAIITRSSNNFGPYQYPEKLIPLFITNALENKELPLYGDGENIRDWLYVKDHCKALDIVLTKGKVGEVYNIASKQEKKNIEVAELILKKLGKPLTLLKFVEDRPGHDRRYSLSTKKIQKLGWKPKYEFNSALESTIEWYKMNKQWWKPLKRKLIL